MEQLGLTNDMASGVHNRLTALGSMGKTTLQNNLIFNQGGLKMTD